MVMPHPIRRSRRLSRRAALAGGLILLAGCTVQPLYQTTAPGIGGTVAPLRTVIVADVNDRVSQQVRNHLIFLLYQGSSPASQAQYSAAITASPSVRDVFATTAPDGSTQVTAKRIVLSGTVTLTDITDGSVIAQATRTATASFDQTRQEFANLRAQRDAENRAADELAEQFRIVIATALAAR